MTNKKGIARIFIVKAILWILLCSVLAGINIITAIIIDSNSKILPIIIDFLSMAIISIPFIWISFFSLKTSSAKKILIQIILCPVYIISWHLLTRIGLYLFKITNNLNISEFINFADFFQGILYYILVFGILNAYYFFTEQQKALSREKALFLAAYNNELNILKAQMQPHFLFNTLTSISASVPAKQESTRRLIAWLADTFRYSLTASKQEWTLLKDEIHFINAILSLEKERFKDRLNFSIYIEKGLEEISIPHMLIQPFIENAIQHGIAPSINGGNINLQIKKDNTYVCVEISDTGIGTETDLEKLIINGGIGISNTQKRLNLIYNQSLILKRNSPSGLIFSFKIPLNYGS